MVVGAAPSWFADNLLLIAAVVLVLVTLLLLRVVKGAARITFVAVVAGIALFIFVNRVPLEACARTCECRIVRQDVTVPFCDPDLQLSQPVTDPARA
ncbi:MAG: hypothetical protein ACJ739_12930 [Acidimicrobiales bacterium]